MTDLEAPVRVYPARNAAETAALLLAAAQSPEEVVYSNPYFIVPARVAVDAGIVEEPSDEVDGEPVQPEPEPEPEPEPVEEPEEDLVGGGEDLSAAVVFDLVHDSTRDEVEDLLINGTLTRQQVRDAETAEGGKNRKGVLALTDEE